MLESSFVYCGSVDRWNGCNKLRRAKISTCGWRYISRSGAGGVDHRSAMIDLDTYGIFCFERNEIPGCVKWGICHDKYITL